MRRAWLLAFGVQWVLIAGLAFVVWQRGTVGSQTGAPAGLARAPITVNGGDHADRDDHDGDTKPAAGTAPGKSGTPVEPGVVRLTSVVQQGSDVRVAAAQLAEAPAGREVWGQVLPTQALAEAHLRLRQAALEVEQWTPQIVRALQEGDRLDALFREGGNVARKTLEQARAERALLEQRQLAARALQDAARLAVRAEWGAALGQALDANDGGMLAGVLAGQQHLLLIADGSQSRARVSVAGSDHPIPVQRLAPAVQVEPGGTGATWYWLGPADALRAGQRVRMAVVASHHPGLQVPESAVVWQAGQAWVYLRVDGEHFRRQAVTLGGALERGWFVDSGLTAGAQVVVQGAQLLLSEESRALIRNENGD